MKNRMVFYFPNKAQSQFVLAYLKAQFRACPELQFDSKFGHVTVEEKNGMTARTKLAINEVVLKARAIAHNMDI